MVEANTWRFVACKFGAWLGRKLETWVGENISKSKFSFRTVKFAICFSYWYITGSCQFRFISFSSPFTVLFLEAASTILVKIYCCFYLLFYYVILFLRLWFYLPYYHNIDDYWLWLLPERLTQVLESERESPREFQPLPFHYVEISRLLFDQYANNNLNMLLFSLTTF